MGLLWWWGSIARFTKNFHFSNDVIGVKINDDSIDKTIPYDGVVGEIHITDSTSGDIINKTYTVPVAGMSANEAKKFLKRMVVDVKICGDQDNGDTCKHDFEIVKSNTLHPVQRIIGEKRYVSYFKCKNCGHIQYYDR